MTIRILHFRPGNDETRVFQYVDSAGDIIDVTDYTATATFTVGTAAPITKTVGSGITLDGVEGKFSVTVTDTDTTNLGDAGHFGRFTLDIRSPAGTDTTLAKGALVVL